MSWLGYILAFILGGSIGFYIACIIAGGRLAELLRENIACIIAGGRLAELLRENQRIKEQLDGHLPLKEYSVLIA
jgi:predicted acylesterase/phospholipase RssA